MRRDLAVGPYRDCPGEEEDARNHPDVPPPCLKLVHVSKKTGVCCEVDADLLFSQTFVDQARLVEIIRSVLPEGSMALLSDVIATHPIEQGAAEIVGYLALNDEDVAVDMDDTDETFLEYSDPADPDTTKRARLPKVTVRRR